MLSNNPDMPFGRPGFSRWDACRDCGLLPGTPGPAEAGAPVQQCLDLFFKIGRFAGFAHVVFFVVQTPTA
jgi:hypothetical protein